MSEQKQVVRWRGPAYGRESQRRKDLLFFTRSFGELVRARVSLVDGLRIAALDAPNARLREVMLAFHEGVAAGEPFHASMARLPLFFPDYYVHAIQVGEETGRVDQTLSELEDLLENSITFHSELIGNVAYLSVLLFVLLLLTSQTIMFVLPQFAEIYSSLGASLPGPAAFLVSFSGGPANWAPTGLTIVFLLVILYLIFGSYRLQAVLAPVKRVLLRAPLVKQIHRKTTLANASAFCADLLRCGMPLDETLKHVAGLQTDSRFAAFFGRLTTRVSEGKSLSEALDADRFAAPKFLRAFVRLGEDSASLPDAFAQIAMVYRQEAVKQARILAGVAFPLCVLAVGLVVFFVYSAFFLAILRLSETALLG